MLPDGKVGIGHSSLKKLEWPQREYLQKQANGDPLTEKLAGSLVTQWGQT